MKFDYTEYQFKDLANFRYGKMPNKKKISPNGSYPVYSGYRYVGYYDEYNVEPKQLIVVARGVGGTGDVKITKEKCYLTNLSIAVDITDTNKVIPEYLYYLFTLNNLRYLDSGSAQSQITITDLEKVCIKLPNISIQHKIVDMLLSLDDKIENNNAINKNLEEQAQVIFAQYFIDIENIPDGWTEGNLTDIAEYLNGLAMQKFRPSNENESLPVLKIKELRQGICDTDSDRCSSKIKKAYIVHDGDVIFSWSGSLLVDFWCGGDCGLNQHLFKVTSEKYDKWFYYVWTNYHLQEFVKMAADRATTMGHIKRDALEKARVLIPNQEDYNYIKELLQPLYDSIIANRIENRKLSALRDTLLPRLMSGEIDISNIEL